MSKRKLPPNQVIDCLNCNWSINSSNSFCQQCGQAIKSYKLSIWQLLREVFSSIFNLESKFFQTIGNIWRPYFLTEAYVRGERKRYLNPGRFFIVSFFLLSAAVSYLLKTSNDNSSSFSETKNLYESSIKEDMIPLFDSLSLSFPLAPEANIDSLRNGMFFSKEQMAKDSIDSPPSIIVYDVGGISTDNEGSTNKYKIATYDIKNLSKEELYEKYNVEGFYNKTLFLQYINFKKDPRSWIIFMLTNSLWTIVVSTFVLAFFMKLLYIRWPYYYVEHLILLMTFQSLMFLIAVIAILAGFCNESISTGLWILIQTFGSIWFVKTLHDYYKQTWFKTILEILTISDSYYHIDVLLPHSGGY